MVRLCQWSLVYTQLRKGWLRIWLRKEMNGRKLHISPTPVYIIRVGKWWLTLSIVIIKYMTVFYFFIFGGLDSVQAWHLLFFYQKLAIFLPCGIAVGHSVYLLNYYLYVIHVAYSHNYGIIFDSKCRYKYVNIRLTPIWRLQNARILTGILIQRKC